MDPAIVAALIAGVFTLVAATIPILVRLRRQSVEQMELPATAGSGGLSAAVGIVQRGRKVLLVQRRTRIGDLSWQFPAGVGSRRASVHAVDGARGDDY